jgi:hypothetical protein
MVNLMEAAYLAIGFVVFVVTVSIGGSVLSSMQIAQTLQPGNATCIATPTLINCATAASNASGLGLGGIANLGSQSGTIGTILGAVIILGLLMGAFAMSRHE